MTTTRREAGSRGACYARAGRTRLISLRAVLILVVLVGMLGPLPATAHPLGNFSISHYSGIRIGRDSIELRYVIDMAEIPTFQEIQETGIVAQTDDPRVEAYLAGKAEVLSEGLVLAVSGQRIPLNVESKEIIFPAGAGGLPTLKIGVLYKGKLDTKSEPPQLALNYRDNNFPGRAGWKEIIAVTEAGVTLVHSSVPQTDRSDRLSNYPTDLLNSPPQTLEARLIFTIPGFAGAVASVSTAPVLAKEAGSYHPLGQTEAKHAGRQRRSNEFVESAGDHSLYAEMKGTQSPAPPDSSQPVVSAPVQLQANKQATPRSSFTELIATQQLGLGIILIALAVAVGLGAFHALEPGHGKTLVAAYLVGSHGTFKHAFLLGLIVTTAHTAGVYLLGAVTLYASKYIVPERLYPWLGVTSGVIIAGLGLALLVRRYLGKDGLLTHTHDHHGHTHHHHDHHDHAHGDAQMHSHAHDKPDRQVSLRELVTLGISGGIVPCPAALVVLLSAVSLQRIGFGLLLIVAFSLGLAAVLIAIGMLMVYARQFMARFQGEGQWTTRWLPLASSAFIVLIGVALTWQALRSAGFQMLAPL